MTPTHTLDAAGTWHYAGTYRDHDKRGRFRPAIAIILETIAVIHKAYEQAMWATFRQIIQTALVDPKAVRQAMGAATHNERSNEGCIRPKPLKARQEARESAAAWYDFEGDPSWNI